MGFGAIKGKKNKVVVFLFFLTPLVLYLVLQRFISDNLFVNPLKNGL